MSKFRAWLELARLSNLPTTWADVLAGFSGGYVTWATTHSRPAVAMSNPFLLKAAVTQGLGVLIAVSLFYIAGMVLNDVADVKIDRRSRSDRPLASGRITLRSAAAVAAVLLLVGLAIVGGYANWLMLGLASGLVAAMIGYDFLHHRTWWAIVLMGACRGLVILLAAAVFGANRLWATELGPLAAIAATYTVLFTLIARLETQAEQDARKFGALGLILVVWLAMWMIQPAGWGWAWAMIAGLGAAGWLGYGAWLVFEDPPQTGFAVGVWIAGFCLADAFYLTLFNQPLVALGTVACFAATRLAQRHIPAT